MAQRSWCLIEQYFLTDLTSRFTYNFIWERLFKGGDGRNSGWRGEGGDGLLQIWSSSGEDRSSFKKEQGLMERSYSFMVA